MTRSLPVLSWFAVLVLIAACGEVKPNVTDGPPMPIDAGVDGTDIDAPPNAVALTIVRGGNATGMVTSDPAGIDCGATCTSSYAPGTLVTLTATPGSGAGFTGWGGACSGALTTCSVLLSSVAAAVNANFDTLRHVVTVDTAGNGSGRITAASVGINCPGTCMATVDHGTSITFTQTAMAGSTFLGWSGACTGVGACTLSITNATQLSAAFGQSQSLIVTKSGNGTGTVTSDPAGINCGGDCSEVYAPGTVVTLTATPSANSVFVGWSSAACNDTAGPCVVTVNAATSVDAIFNLRQFTLTVTKSGAGTGTITSIGPGINCGTDCTETYNAGTMVQLVPSAGMDSEFTGWSGDCTGLSVPCNVTMAAARNVGARFSQSSTVLLTLVVYGAGRLDASPNPVSGPMTCASTDPNTTTCQLTYPRDSNVTLRPTAQPNFQLIEIVGCTPSGSSCVLTMSGSRTVSAYYCSPSGACPI